MTVFGALSRRERRTGWFIQHVTETVAKPVQLALDCQKGLHCYGSSIEASSAAGILHARGWVEDVEAGGRAVASELLLVSPCTSIAVPSCSADAQTRATRDPQRSHYTKRAPGNSRLKGPARTPVAESLKPSSAPPFRSALGEQPLSRKLLNLERGRKRRTGARENVKLLTGW